MAGSTPPLTLNDLPPGFAQLIVQAYSSKQAADAALTNLQGAQGNLATVTAQANGLISAANADVTVKQAAVDQANNQLANDRRSLEALEDAFLQPGAALPAAPAPAPPANGGSPVPPAPPADVSPPADGGPPAVTPAPPAATVPSPTS